MTASAIDRRQRQEPVGLEQPAVGSSAGIAARASIAVVIISIIWKVNVCSHTCAAHSAVRAPGLSSSAWAPGLLHPFASIRWWAPGSSGEVAVTYRIAADS